MNLHFIFARVALIIEMPLGVILGSECHLAALFLSSIMRLLHTSLMATYFAFQTSVKKHCRESFEMIDFLSSL